ncbi:MAG TPA: RNA polymerase subunit sigma-70 [Alteromonas sp.]|nr:RNA polymerase subunit sigma-70 [Alteromonas sp.]
MGGKRRTTCFKCSVSGRDHLSARSNRMSAQGVISSDDVIAAQHGDESAFNRLVAASRNTIASIALAITRDLDASEEITQQVFINCWQKLHTLKNAASFLPWVRQSARYAAYNYLRDNRLADRVGGEEADALFAAYCDDELPPETRLSREQTGLLLKQVVDELPEESREMVLLYYREDQSASQVAELLSVSPELVRQRLSRARKALKASLMERYGQLILTTAPTLTITSILLAGASVSAPAQASGGTVLAKSGGAGVLKILLSGAFFAALLGALSVFWSTRLPLKNMTMESQKVRLKQLRKITIIWVLATGVLLAAAYELTTGWVMPVLAYTLFAGGLSVQVKKMQRVIMYDLFDSKTLSADSERQAFWQRCWGNIGLYGALLVGFASMIIGLIGSGRL